MPDIMTDENVIYKDERDVENAVKRYIVNSSCQSFCMGFAYEGGGGGDGFPSPPKFFYCRNGGVALDALNYFRTERRQDGKPISFHSNCSNNEPSNIIFVLPQ